MQVDLHISAVYQFAQNNSSGSARTEKHGTTAYSIVVSAGQIGELPSPSPPYSRCDFFKM